ncbi:30S ribosomal protein S9, partial [Candidatus Parcubacteria bacterium]|nr:30S ribosomal protein S9 [Candidatus Parcubacteria bacterium]
KTAVAQVRLYQNGKGIIMINQQKVNQYFLVVLLRNIVNQPLKLTGHLRDLNISILVRGGGKKAQAEAVRHGIVRALVKFDKELKPSLKAKGWLTRDARKKERKKPGLKKARRAPQWSKR